MVPFVHMINPLNAELNPIRHLLALVGAHHILHVSRVRVKLVWGSCLLLILCFFVLICFDFQEYNWSKGHNANLNGYFGIADHLSGYCP
jgi:hypothetical protein